MVYPRMTVPAPVIGTAGAVSPGLFSAASLQGAPSTHWMLGGVEYVSNGQCANPEGWTPVCPPDVPTPKNATEGFEIVEGDAFTGVLGLQCRLVGFTLEEFETRVRTTFLNCVERFVEEAFWTGNMGNDPHLADPSTVIVGGFDAANPATITGGVAALESYLGDNLCSVGYFHAPRGLNPFAARVDLLVDPATARMRTPLGTRWVFGGGYSANTGPDGTPAPPGVAWIYATGQVNIWRSDVKIAPADLRAAFNATTNGVFSDQNDVTIFAEQTFAITRECLTAAVAVRIGCDC